MSASRLEAVTVYVPGSPLREPGKLLRSMFSDLLASRELAWRLFVRDLSAQYRQSLFGYVWAFLPPLATTAVFAFLNSQSILDVGSTPIPYPAFVMIGTLLWQTFIDALNSPLRSMTNAKSMLAKINFPREALILGGIADVLFNVLVRATLLVPTFMIYDLPVGRSLLLAPVGILALLLLGLAIGTVLTPVGLLYGDVGRGIALVSSFWMLLTPVVYPPPTSGIGSALATWNPVSPVLLTSRQWLISQPVTNLGTFTLATIVSALVLVVGWLLVRLALPHIIERIGN